LKKITKIEIQKKRKNRFSIFLDGEFAFGLDQDVLLKFGLSKGVELSESDIESILIAEEKKQAKDRALKFLGYRDRSEKEIIDKLKLIGYDKPVIEWVISELKRMQLIDDSRFAQSFAKTKMLAKPMGEYLLRCELKRKGIQEHHINAAIENIFEERDPVSIAIPLAQKQILKYKNVDELKRKKRLTDFLLRRGFNWEVITEVIEELEHN